MTSISLLDYYVCLLSTIHFKIDSFFIKSQTTTTKDYSNKRSLKRSSRLKKYKISSRGSRSCVLGAKTMLALEFPCFNYVRTYHSVRVTLQNIGLAAVLYCQVFISQCNLKNVVLLLALTLSYLGT